MIDYKKMCVRLLRTNYILKSGLKVLAQRDEYGDLRNVIMSYFYEFDRIDKRISPFPQKAKVRRICKKREQENE